MKMIRLEGAYNLPIHQATFDYITGINPRLEWEERGISAHSDNLELQKKLEEEKERAKQYLKTEEGQKELTNFINECSNLFSDLLNNSNCWKEEHLNDKEIIFVIGAMRTAGTYLYTQLSEVFNIGWKNLNIKMSHDSIPTYMNLFNWSDPSNWLSLMFEMSQFLNWAQKECMKQELIIQKRIAYGHALPFLNKLFGEKAKYIITVRHPGAIARSFKKLEGIDMKNIGEPAGWRIMAKQRKGITNEQWEKLSYNERVLVYWQIYYEDVAKYGLPDGDVCILSYGKESYENFLIKMAEQYNKDYSPEEFKETEREYDDFWYSEQVNNTIEEVKFWWQVHGIGFPELELK